MADILAENLSGKRVMGTDGMELGQLYNITMLLKAGSLQELVVEPDEDATIDPDLPVDEQGRYRIPVGDVQAVKDHILVAR
ncbi:MAG: PRC-barrel domain-containing protein [Halobacteriaceae archaeon]